MKKLIIVGVFVFAFALTMNVAFAECIGCGQQQCPCPDQSNTAINVNNGVSSSAYTGNNTIYQAGISGNGINTGNATSSARGISAVNSNVALGDTGRGDYTQTNKAYKVDNGTASLADTGLNSIYQAHVSGAGTAISTGNSTSRVSGISLVNTNVKIGCPCRKQGTTCGSCQ